MSETILKSVKKQLLKERGERRKAEREEFGIKVNEFDDEIFNIVAIKPKKMFIIK